MEVSRYRGPQNRSQSTMIFIVGAQTRVPSFGETPISRWPQLAEACPSSSAGWLRSRRGYSRGLL